MIINLTPHSINLIAEDGTVFAVFESAGVARATQSRNQVGQVEVYGKLVAINSNTFGEPEGLPEPQKDVFYIVSALAAKAVPARNDLLLVDDTVRDGDNRIVGCRAFARPD